MANELTNLITSFPTKHPCHHSSYITYFSKFSFGNIWAETVANTINLHLWIVLCILSWSNRTQLHIYDMLKYM